MNAVSARKLGVGAAALAVLVTGGRSALAASAGSGAGSNDATGPDVDRAVRAALGATGGGSASGVELDDEHGATWEVEVARRDGSVVDVRLDELLRVVLVEIDEGAGEPETDD